ncbi:4-hydroxy-tetrahydrodipicolinate synthase [Gottfriedia solisilvae]|uniref:4-hydroxy-tetrahydrodipicolinate synthase n=1 Tax=Gottfriedia solisilvae TaxID=1516104 RepID=A0A8J3EWJ2_9BACI|nr:4-hydroxy-tetrahydrodipicolinate synthase [Gottfriedia solisilvae]GGI14120.1 4-hydroxy-tetrahydrodipicolinate synthase [Gottfriedia solisilvae]
MSRFGKISTAMVTPFDSKGNIDFAKTTKLVNYLIENGTDSIVVCGTTGESPTLTSEEKLALIRHVVTVVDGRIPVIAGTGSNDTRATVSLTKKVTELGVDAIMVVVPYYNKPNQEGLYQHFKAAAESTELPVMLYNVPGRTVANLAIDTVVRLAEVPNIVAIKDATGNLGVMTEIIDRTPEDFELYCGDDGLTLPAFAIGSKGTVSVASHVLGNEMQLLAESFFTGNMEQAQFLHRKLLPLFDGFFMAPSPSPIKTALQMKGLDVGGVRLPLVPLTEAERTTLTSLMNQLEEALQN